MHPVPASWVPSTAGKCHCMCYLLSFACESYAVYMDDLKLYHTQIQGITIQMLITSVTESRGAWSQAIAAIHFITHLSEVRYARHGAAVGCWYSHSCDGPEALGLLCPGSVGTVGIDITALMGSLCIMSIRYHTCLHILVVCSHASCVLLCRHYSCYC